MSSIQAAIDGATTALQAVNWVTAVGSVVTVDSTPNRTWTLQERRSGPIVYLFGGGSEFEFNERAGLLMERPTLFVAVMRHISVDGQGQLLAAGLTAAEAVLTQTIKTTRDWAKASDRFAPLQFVKPERFDAEQALKGEYLSTLALILLDGQRL